MAPESPTRTRSTPASSTARALGKSYAVTMTMGSPRRFFSNSRGRVIGRREASAGVWMFGCALMATQPPGCPLALRIVLSMRRVLPTLAATATSTWPSTRATGERSSGWTSAR